MNSTLLIIGLSHRTAPIQVRERFWIDEAGQQEALRHLAGAAGIEEVCVLATCNRTEFICWANEAGAAAAAVREFLTREYGLRLCDWKFFYRLLGEAALAHLFRVASSLDSMVPGEPEITGQVKAAWARAQQAQTTGRFLDTAFQKALSVAKRVPNETAVGNAAVSVPYAAVELARRIFGSLAGHGVLVMGSGKMGELSARYLTALGVSAVHVCNRTFEHAGRLARDLGGVAVPFELRNKYLVEDDIVISSTGSPEPILTRADAESLRRERLGRPLFLIDIAVPRDIEPSVRHVAGVFLYDIDDLAGVVEQNLAERKAAAQEAEPMVAREARAWSARLEAERVVPTIVEMRRTLEEIRRQEWQRYQKEIGRADALDERAVEALTERIVQRIGNRLAGELKQIQEGPERERVAAVVQRLFRLPRAQAASAEPLPRQRELLAPTS